MRARVKKNETSTPSRKEAKRKTENQVERLLLQNRKKCWVKRGGIIGRPIGKTKWNIENSKPSGDPKRGESTIEEE